MYGLRQRSAASGKQLIEIWFSAKTLHALGLCLHQELTISMVLQATQQTLCVLVSLRLLAPIVRNRVQFCSKPKFGKEKSSRLAIRRLSIAMEKNFWGYYPPSIWRTHVQFLLKLKIVGDSWRQGHKSLVRQELFGKTSSFISSLHAREVCPSLLESITCLLPFYIDYKDWGSQY